MYRKIIKVFLGSPGDLEDERKAAKVIVDEENANHANSLGYHIDLVGWEDTVSQRRRAQDAINGDLVQCEYFVGLMWKKWGTPPGPEGHIYTSGFEEEYRLSVERHKESGKPEISLLFKNIPEDDLSDVGKQLARVLEFQKEINEEKKQYYQKFQDLRDFEHRFRAIIAKFLREQQLEDSKSEILGPQKPKSEDEKCKGQRGRENPSQMFDAGAITFIEDFIAKEPDGENSCSAAEAARFRLLACSVSQSENDTIRLGTHDANLIYRDLRGVEFSEQESRKLVSTALESLDSSTVPLWHWIFRPSYNIQSALPSYTLLGVEEIRRSAFKLLGMLHVAPKDFESGFDKAEYLDFWLSENVSNELLISALEYLGVVGDDDFQIHWGHYMNCSEANVSLAAVRSFVRIKSRVSIADALRFVAKHESINLGSELAGDLLSNVSTIESEVLRRCLKNKTRAFRRTIAIELFERGALTMSDGYLICESTEADIRLIGAKALAKLNPRLALSDVRKLLVKPGTSDLSGQRSSSQDYDFPGLEAFKNYQIGVLSKMPYQDLLDVKKEESLFQYEATIALYRGHFKREKADLEKNLLDGFDEFCTSWRDTLERLGAADSELTHNFVRENLVQDALDAYCYNAGKSDLSVVRRVLDEHDVRFSTEVVQFIAKHGEWEDTARIAKLSGKTILSSMSYIDHSMDHQLAGRTILKLGAKRIADVWKLDLQSQVRVQLVVQMPKKIFAAFDDQGVIDMLLLDSDVVREVVALKAILYLPKTRLRRILNTYCYMIGGHYYNAVFWLDLGVSADRKTSRTIAQNALTRIIHDELKKMTNTLQSSHFCL